MSRSKVQGAARSSGGTEHSVPARCWCAVYTRQSRASDAEYSSCEAQLAACLNFTMARLEDGWVWNGKRYDDAGASGEKLDRPGLQRLLADIDAGAVQRVVVYRLDRLSRSVVHCAELLQRFRDRGVGLAIVTSPELGESAQDMLVLNLLSSFAEFERDIIRDRLTDARARLKQRGRRVAGVVPFGYVSDPITKQLLPQHSEARRVRAMFERAAKGETPRQIAEHANRYGWRTKRSVARKTGNIRGANRWTPRQVLALLTNPVYAGLIRVGGQHQPGVHEPLISRELFDRVAAGIAGRRMNDKPRPDKSMVSWPLRGKIYCGSCGRLMSPSTSGHRTVRYRHYRCRSHAGGRPPCPGASVPAEEIERTICQMLGQRDTSPGEGGADGERLAFSRAWAALPERSQRKLLPIVVDKIALNVGRGTLSVTLVPGALDVINGAK